MGHPWNDWMILKIDRFGVATPNGLGYTNRLGLQKDLREKDLQVRYLAALEPLKPEKTLGLVSNLGASLIVYTLYYVLFSNPYLAGSCRVYVNSLGGPDVSSGVSEVPRLRCLEKPEAEAVSPNRLASAKSVRLKSSIERSNMFAANPTFARIGSRISLDMLKSMLIPHIS